MESTFDIDKHHQKRIKIFEDLLNDKSLSGCCINNKNFPEPYHNYCSDTKAIVLGADPTNPGKEELKFVFGLEDKRSPYFSLILKNLERLGLGLDDIYVQNLCPNYFKNVTDENKEYEEIASKYWLPFLREELDAQFPKAIPVLVTAWKPLTVVASEAKSYKNKKSEIYSRSMVFSKNNLDRPVLAFFRGGYRRGYNGYYDIEFPEFKNYKNLIKSLF